MNTAMHRLISMGLCLRIEVAFTLCSAVTFGGTVSGADAVVNVTASLERTTVMVGEPIVMLVHFYNATTSEYTKGIVSEGGRILLDEGDIEVALKATLTSPNSSKASWRARYKRHPQVLDVLVPIIRFPAKRTTTRPVYLSRVFQPEAVGDYELAWQIRLPVRATDDDEDRFAEGEGTLRFRVERRDERYLAKRADELLDAAWKSAYHDSHALQSLATIAPDVAVTRFRRYLQEPTPKGQKRSRDTDRAIHNLIYLDTTAAVDLIGDMLRSSYKDGQAPTPHQPGYVLYFRAIDTLLDMHSTTEREEIRKHIRATLEKITLRSADYFLPSANDDH